MSESARPLEGRTVLITRAASQAPRFVALLEADGARVIEAPTIAIEPPPSWAPLDDALDRADAFTWVIFTSVNGVAMVSRRLRERAETWDGLARRDVAAIGPATAQALEREGVRVALVPAEYRAEALVDRLRGRLQRGDRVLLPRAAETRDVLVRELDRLGAVVEEVPAYVTRRVAAGGERVRAALASRGVDAVTFTSSSTVRNFAEMFTPDERRALLGGVTIACIGPITAATAAEYGLATDVMPEEYTIPALARALSEHLGRAATDGSADHRISRGAAPPSEASL
jgi:uroporphyrinogen III methyltransferase/synthase